MKDYNTDENLNHIHRYANLVGDKISLGVNCRIDAFATITGQVVIGDNVHIGVGVCIFAGHGMVTIGDGVSLSPGCRVFTGTDDPAIDTVTNPQLKPNGGLYGDVSIGDYATIGAGCVVLPRVSIGANAQVGALSLVKKDVANNEIAAGVPAESIGRVKSRAYGDNPQ